MRTFIPAVLMLTVLSIGMSTTHRVPQDFATVQLAINAADNGDTVLVAEGTFVENLFVNKNIVLGSLFLTDGDTSHISKTIIDGSGSTNPDSGAVITLGAAADTTLEIIGFTITKGKGNKSWDYLSVVYWMAGGGIESGVGGSARIAYNRIVKNSCVTTGTVDSIYGGGIGISNPNNSVRPYIIIEHNTIGDNTVNGYITEAGGIGLYFMSGRIMNNIIENNSNTSSSSYCKGGGLCIGITTPLTIANNIIRNNTAQGSGSNGDGGGLSVYGNATLGATNIALHNNIFVGNTTYRGGAIFVLTRTTINAVNNTFYDNNATLGSAVRVAQYTTGIVRLMNNIIANNNPNDQVSTTGGYIYAHNNIIHGQSFGSFNYNVSPQFIPSDPLCRLSVQSPAIAKGVNAASVGGLVLYAPETDFTGSPRPNPSWSRCDLGAVESPYAILGHPAVHRVPQDFATVQSAINAAQESDLVLVAEGTFVENLKINKKITLASLFYQDQDTSHISKTILDGGSPPDLDSGSVIIVGAGTDSTTQITGFTIRNGFGTRQLLNEVNWRGGFGIYIAAGAARISHNIITSNSLTSSEPLFGGGIAVVPTPGPLGYWIIEYNSIMHNHLSSSVTSTDGGIEGGGLRLSLTGRLTHNLIYDNSVLTTGGSYAGGGGIYAGSFGGFALASMPSTNVVIANNEIRGNSSNGAGGWGGGVGGVVGPGGASTVSTTLLNNIVCGNTALLLGSAIHFHAGSHVLINNTIAGNTGKNAIEVQSYRAAFTLRMLNNILWNPDVTSDYTVGGGSYPKNRYSDYNLVRGGMTGTGNINADPLFVVGDTLYRLQPGSPCLGHGRMVATVGGTDLFAPTYDFLGNPRPMPTAWWPDIGAIEMPIAGAVRELDGLLPTEFILSQNYPNPFNPSTTIRYALPERVAVHISIHDLLGREIETLVDDEQSAGWKEVQWNAKDISSGVYFYSLKAGTFSEIKKMILIK